MPDDEGLSSADWGLLWTMNHATSTTEPAAPTFPLAPYKSMDDAKLARSTISECPPPDPADEKE